MKKSEIIKQAKRYFGKNRSFIKDLVLGYEFTGKNYRQWKLELKNVIPNANEVKFGIFDDVVLWIKENKAKEINWNWIGDLSWSIEILLNKNIQKGYDWDKKLAMQCNGTARIIQVFVSDVLPCYTYDSYYMTYNKKDNYYEFGPLTLTKAETEDLKIVFNLLKSKGLQFLDKTFCNQKFKELYSDTNSDGNASLFDVLFSDTYRYTTEIKRFCDENIIEKNGNKFRWSEIYSKNGTLKERVESRWTKSGDYLKVVLDSKDQITEVEVTRKKIENKKYQQFKLDIIDEFKKRKTKNKKNIS